MPNMFNTFPRAELEKVHHIPRAIFQEKEKAVVDGRFRQEKDPANVLLNFDDVNAKDRVVWFPNYAANNGLPSPYQSYHNFYDAVCIYTWSGSSHSILLDGLPDLTDGWVDMEEVLSAVSHVTNLADSQQLSHVFSTFQKLLVDNSISNTLVSSSCLR